MILLVYIFSEWSWQNVDLYDFIELLLSFSKKSHHAWFLTAHICFGVWWNTSWNKYMYHNKYLICFWCAQGATRRTPTPLEKMIKKDLYVDDETIAKQLQDLSSTLKDEHLTEAEVQKFRGKWLVHVFVVLVWTPPQNVVWVWTLPRMLFGFGPLPRMLFGFGPLPRMLIGLVFSLECWLGWSPP